MTWYNQGPIPKSEFLNPDERARIRSGCYSVQDRLMLERIEALESERDAKNTEIKVLKSRIEDYKNELFLAKKEEKCQSHESTYV